MAVYEQRYKPFAGALTPQWTRFLVIPRHAYGDIFRSKIFTGFFALCFVPVLVALILVYLHHNTAALMLMELSVGDLLPIDGVFFEFFVFFQGILAFLLTVLVGPRLIARDVTDNAIALYLCRPFSRTEYVLGKLAVLLILLSAITWVPLLLVFVFQAFLAGGAWFAENAWMAAAIFLGSAVWILMLALLALSISAWMKWATAARGALIALYFIPIAFAAAIDELFRTNWGGLISIRSVMNSIRGGLFAVPQYIEVPVASAWVAVAIVYAVCLLLLARKVRAYEVIK